ncbi:M20 aminoacylase family protein [Falsiroseomonas sp.]|uniref:M20 aminoacylase family protein n=1 Tax=Falsiroseomonas sp. TaxID=2870721 RepID=UPI002716A535|nr:M20 aminoacylase family protein [Falsiroseomonas sp.]MDO9502294.1 M20 aminoacylase family protein [Falsiroseomonas sp.]
MPINNRIAAMQPEMEVWRRDLHTHPELRFQEHRTAAQVAKLLAGWGIEVHTGIATTGVVGVLRGNGASGRSIGLRADMDALPMTEATGLPYASTTPGVMHACGHDGHTTMLLGAAKYLAETRNFDGTVHFIFQPAEEGGAGAKVMMDEGLFTRFPCDSVYGMHNDPSLPIGEADIRDDVMMAAADGFTVIVRGKGGHAARPHGGIDPIVVGAQIVGALQTIVARRVDPLESAVISTTQFHAGTAGNVIPDEAMLNGTVRTLSPAVRDLVEATMRRVVEATAAAHDAVAELAYTRGYPPTVNHAENARLAARICAGILGEGKVRRDMPPVMGAEDFSYMLLEKPGAYIKLGQAAGTKGRAPVHTVQYDFNDDLLPIGASFFAGIVEQELKRG